MKRNTVIRLIGILLTVLTLGSVIAPLTVLASPSLTVTEGKVCSLVEPLGIEGTPIFSWKVASDVPADKQLSYRIIVAKSRKDAEQGKNAVWDSGTVTSSQTLDIPYGGVTLAPRTSYYWRVTVTNSQNKSADSDVYRFSTGVEPEAWTGDWIGMPAPKPTLSLTGAKWIWLTSGASFSGVPAGSEYFRFSFTVPDGKTVENFEIAYTADDAAEVFVNGTKVSEMSLWSDGSFYCGNTLVTGGKNTVAIAATNASVGYAGLCAKIAVRYSDGTSDVYTTKRSDWRVLKGTAPSGWKETDFDDSAWKAPDQEVAFGSAPWGTGVALRGESSRAAVYLRREFEAKKEIKEALVSLCGLGFFNLSVNGTAPDDSVLNPFTTQYDVAVYYRTFDVTDLLKKGDNAIAVTLGNSYYNEIGGVWNWQTASWRDDPKLILRLDLRYSDGTADVIVSDTSWQATANAPITDNSMYYGDVYDARLALDGFDTVGYDSSAWENAAVMAKPLGKLESQMKAPVSRVASFAPAEIVKLGENSWRVESPEMIAGWVHLKNINEQAGQKITLTYGQKLNADGSVLKYGFTDGELAGWYPHAYFQQDIYYSAGKKNESYEPTFSYKGFEYVQIDGYSGELTADDVVIYRVSNDVEIISEFESSNPLFNTLHKCMLTALVDNFHGEHCDPMLEKNGWLGDANVSLASLIYNFDMAATLPGFIELMEDTQEKYGFVPQMVPAANWGIQNTAVWNTIFIYGVEALENHFGTYTYSEAQYAEMRKMAIRDINEMRANGWVWHDDQLADWVAPIGGSNPNVAYNENMSEGSGIVGTAFVYGTLRYMASLAEHMGKDADAAEYQNAMEKIYTAFNKKFFRADKGYYETTVWSQIGTRTQYRQTSNLVPLAFGLVPEEHIKSVVDSIVADVIQKDYHLDTGCVGTRYILPILCDYGHSEVAYRIATQTTYPSWGFWIENGAKSTWEMWESTTRSFDHYFLGTYDEWFFSHLGGIKNVKNGYESFTVDPEFVGDLTYVNTALDTVRGKLGSSWKRLESGKLEMTVTVPFGSTAEVRFPTADVPAVRGENGEHLSIIQGVLRVSKDENGVFAVLGSGSYRFIITPDTQKVTVYRHALQTALDRLKLLLDKHPYIVDYTEIDAVLDKTNRVFYDENADQYAVNAATAELEVILQELDGSEAKNALRAAVSQSEKEHPKVLYPEAAYAAYREVLLEAKLLANQRNVTDAALRAAQNTLKEAEIALSESIYQNLAPSAKISASSTHEDTYWKWGLALLTDGNRRNQGPQAGEYTGYSSANTPNTDHEEWLLLDFGSPVTVNTVVLFPSASFDGECYLAYGLPKDLVIDISSDGKTFKTIYDGDFHTLSEYGAFVLSFDETETRYLRVRALSLRPKETDGNSYRMQIAELEVYSLSAPLSTDLEAFNNTFNDAITVLHSDVYRKAEPTYQAAFYLAYTKAKLLVADENALQAEITAAMNRLKDAMAALEAHRVPDTSAPDSQPQTPTTSTPTTTDPSPAPSDSLGSVIAILAATLTVLIGVVIFLILKKKKRR